MAIEPTFRYPGKKAAKPSSVEANIAENNRTSEQKPAKKKRRNRRDRNTGSSFGWGWFQGFNLFVTLYFLIIFLIFGYFMMGGESRHEGLPKYVLDRADLESGKVIFNPQIPEEIRKSYLYVPPVKAPTVDDDELESLVKQQQQLELLSNEQQAPMIELISDEEENLVEELVEYRAEEWIEMAQMAKSMGNYVGTNQQDAYYFYQQALIADPNNYDAKNGIAEIAYIYYQHADRAMFEGDYRKADQYIRVGLIVDPTNQGLQDLQKELEFFIRDYNPTFN